MAAVKSICQTLSSLTDVQIHILKNSEALLQFASDLSHREVYVYVPGRNDHTMILAAQRHPFFKGREQSGEQPETGTIVTIYDEPLVWRVLVTGKPLRGMKETAYGRMEPIQCYPFVDNGGLTIGVISFVGAVEPRREILTETAFLSLQVPLTEHREQLYRQLSLQDGIILVDGEGTIQYADEMAESIMQLRGRAKRLTGENIYNSHVGLNGVKRAIETRQGLADEVQHGDIIFKRRVIPILRRGRIDRIIAVITERTELYQKEEELLIKMSVIKEIHHRVKNNLQTIASLLRMQMRRVQSEEARQVLQESLNRIVSISLVHETLSRHDEERINVSEAAEKLLSLVLRSLENPENPVKTVFHGDPLVLSSDAATSLLLVLNELVTNAVLHGLKGRCDGIVKLTIACHDGQAVVTVEDNGCGMPKTGKQSEGHSHLGLKIIRTLVEKDLQGTIAYRKAVQQGTTAVISFLVR